MFMKRFAVSTLTLSTFSHNFPAGFSTFSPSVCGKGRGEVAVCLESLLRASTGDLLCCWPQELFSDTLF